MNVDMPSEKLTWHYEWFRKIREIESCDFGIRKSFRLDPIIVNDKYEIIEGLDRFEEWKKRNLPIRYIVLRGLGRAEKSVYRKAFD